ncbi:MAG TPA: hypothetical protein VGD64_09915 [Acidisarcina sp.]
MEADWAVEIGAGLDCIDVPWSGEDWGPGSSCEFIDLLAAPELSASIARIPEARDESALCSGLIRLNGPGSPVFTSKCDLWTLESGEIDSYELDAAGPVIAGRASYIDFVFRDAARFASFDAHERWMRRVVDYLRQSALRSVRVDFVLRQAEVRGVEGFGISFYAIGCGPDGVSAALSWEAALAAAVEAICDQQYLSAAD